MSMTLCGGGVPTSLAGVVHQQDLQQQVAGRACDDAVHRPQQGAPRLVVEHDHDAGGREVVGEHLALTPGREGGGEGDGRRREGSNKQESKDGRKEEE